MKTRYRECPECDGLGTLPGLSALSSDCWRCLGHGTVEVAPDPFEMEDDIQRAQAHAQRRQALVRVSKSRDWSGYHGS